MGRGQNIGDRVSTEKIIAEFKKVAPHLIIRDINPLEIEELYVTATGYFGSLPTDATWDMIDEKYHLNILHNSLFTEAEISFYALNRLISEQLIIPLETFQNDYAKAVRNNQLNSFYQSLNEDAIRNYLTKDYSLKRKL